MFSKSFQTIRFGKQSFKKHHSYFRFGCKKDMFSKQTDWFIPILCKINMGHEIDANFILVPMFVIAK